MVAMAQLYPQPERLPKPDGRSSAIARLKLLHTEAAETAHLANLLGRSLHAGIALPILAVVTVGLSDAMNPTAQLIWCGFVAVVSMAMLAAYRRAMRKPFERTSLKDFAKDLSAILLFAGFAWGSGAFLVLPVGTSSIAAVLFAAAPSLIIAYLLRDREALYLFLAPVASLTVAASLLSPFADGFLATGLIIFTSAAVAGAALFSERLIGAENKPAMLSLP
jgi:hypothetical protein